MTSFEIEQENIPSQTATNQSKENAHNPLGQLEHKPLSLLADITNTQQADRKSKFTPSSTVVPIMRKITYIVCCSDSRK